MLLALTTTRPGCSPSLIILLSSAEDDSLPLIREMAEENRSFGIAATVAAIEDLGAVIALQRTDALRDICQYAGRTVTYEHHTAQMLSIIAASGATLAV